VSSCWIVLLIGQSTLCPCLRNRHHLSQGAAGGVNGLSEFAFTMLGAFAALAFIILVGRAVLRPLFHQVAMTRSTEFFMAACLLVVVGAGIAAAAAGLSMALGAFIAGLLLAETEYRREVETTIEPFKGLLLGLFFVSIGASLDLAHVAAQPLSTMGMAIALIACKVLILLALARASGYSAPASQEIALPLGPGGEFAFVMIAAAMAANMLAPADGAHITVAVTLSMMTIPLLALFASYIVKLQPEAPVSNADIAPEGEESDHVIFVGYGRVGQLVTQMLKRHNMRALVVDGDANLVRRERANGADVSFGDTTRPDFLRLCGLMNARALVLTMDSPRAIEIITAMAHRERPDLIIAARARDAHHATVLYGLGATDAIPETIEASLQLSEALLVGIGVPMGHVIASIHEKRDEYRAMLQPSADGARV